MAVASTRLEQWKAPLDELKRKEQAGELILVKAVMRSGDRIVRRIRADIEAICGKAVKRKEEKLLSAMRVAAEIGGIAGKTIYRRAKRGLIPSYRIGVTGRRVGFRIDEVLESLRLTGMSDAADTDVMPAVVIVPLLPMFSPAAVARVVEKSPATVHYWLENGKLEFLRDNIGERYVLRDELVRFIREYLQREVQR